ncbi:hypothetical protein AHAS_Ahas06G0117300 [Arachis hypogaea]
MKEIRNSSRRNATSNHRPTVGASSSRAVATSAHCCHHGFLHRRSNHRRRSNSHLDVYPDRSTASPPQQPGFFSFPS